MLLTDASKVAITAAMGGIQIIGWGRAVYDLTDKSRNCIILAIDHHHAVAFSFVVRP